MLADAAASAPSTISSATPASRAGAAADSAPARPSATSSARCSATSSPAAQRSRSQVFRGADLRYELELDLEQAVFGTETEIQDSDAGRSARPATARARPRARRRRPAIPATARVRCACSNRYSPSSSRARAARAAARSSAIPATPATARDACARRRRSPCSVPAGVDSGDRIRLSGEGEAGRNGGPTGDLYVEIRVREHAIFEREGSHLSCEVPISFATAALGGSVEVPTLDRARWCSRSRARPNPAGCFACARRA